MPRGIGTVRSARASWPAAAASCAVLGLLAACAGPGGGSASRFAAYRHHYEPPGPPEDPWGPYIREAAARFSVPEQWVRAVMRQESGGRDDAYSSAGAMGLMQVMPATYAMLQAHYGLGNDPYEPHDNIMAGTAYIREMYDRYGSPGFLAAYNAGPNRVDDYLANGTPLPDETVGYLSAIAPRLGAGTAMSGPLSVYAGDAAVSAAPYIGPAETTPQFTRVAAEPAGSCDPDAAYDPDRPCTPATSTETPPLRFAESPAAPMQPTPVVTTSAICSPNPPPAPVPAGGPSSYSRYVAPRAPVQPHLVYATAPASAPAVELASLSTHAGGNWSIQVGAFMSSAAARSAAAEAQQTLPALLSGAAIAAPPTTPFGGAILYRARLVTLSAESAAAACQRLSARGAACMAIPPGR